MTLDLERALRAAVDDGPATHRPLGGPGGTLALRARVRRRRAARTAGRATVGAGAACAVGLGAIGWHRTPDTPPPAASASSTAPDAPAATPNPVLPARPVTPSTSALCGLATADLPDDPGDVTVTLGLPGVDLDAGRLVGRSVGSSVPVWLTVPADAGGTAADPSAESLTNAEILLVQDDAVVAVADSAASVVSVDDPTAAMLERAQAGTAGTGELHACPGTAPEGLAGAVPAAGDYQLLAVGELARDGGGRVRRAVSQTVPITLLPEQALLPADADGLPADFPLAAVPLIGDRVLAASPLGADGWQVTVPADGTDALQRASDALGNVLGSAISNRLTGSTGDVAADLSGAETAAWQAAVTLDTARAGRTSDDERGGPYTGYSWGGGSFSLTSDALEIEVREQTDGGVNSLVYRVAPR